MKKKILSLLVGLLMITNVTFAMSGYVDIQTINGVHIGMSADEVVEKWGEPLKTDMIGYVLGHPTYRFYFKPGGLVAGFFTWSFSGQVNDPYINSIKATNNPQIVLQPSGVGIGTTEAEVISRLGNPDKKIVGDYDSNIGFNYSYKYITPEYKNFSGRIGYEEIYVHISEKTKQVYKIELSGTLAHRK